MKRLLIATAAIIFSFVATAQSGVLKSATSWNADTIIDAGTKYLTLPTGMLTGKYDYCSVSVNLLNISGTSSATVTLEHSADGVVWYSVPIDSVLTMSGSSSKGIIWNGYRDRQFRIKAVGSGTQHTKVSAYYSLK